MVVGYGLVGVSAFALLAAGPRLLGGAGLLGAGADLDARDHRRDRHRCAGRAGHHTRDGLGSGTGVVLAVGRRMAVLPVLCAVFLPLGLSIAQREISDEALWVTTVVASAAAWVALASVRGVLAGRHRFAAYAMVLLTEAATRVFFVVLAFAWRPNAALLLGGAVVVPLVAAAAVGWWFLRRRHEVLSRTIAEDSSREHGAMTTVALLGQVCLSTAPLWLSWQSTDDAIAGAFVSATSYMRIPLLLAGGLYGPILAEAARQFAAGNRSGVANRTLAGLIAGIGGTTAAVAILLFAAEPALFILYGGDIGLAPAVLVWLGFTTIASVASNVAMQVLFGCQRALSAAAAWVPPALLTTALLATAGGDVLWMSVSMAIGQVVATLLLLALLPRALPQHVERGRN